MRPGEIITAEDPVPLNPGRERVRLTVVNRADRAVQVGSHYHFAAVNPGLEFDRAAAWGHRLDVPAGTAGGPTACAKNMGVAVEVAYTPTARRGTSTPSDTMRTATSQLEVPAANAEMRSEEPLSSESATVGASPVILRSRSA